jgi:hypothetical protein
VLALGQAWRGVVPYIAACIVTFFSIRFVGGGGPRRQDGKVAARLLRRLDPCMVTSILLFGTLFHTVPALNHTLAIYSVRFRTCLTARFWACPCLLRCIAFFSIAWPRPCSSLD